MKQTKTTLKELTAAYRAVLRHGILCNAIALGLIAAVPSVATAGAPNLSGNAFVFGDISVPEAYSQDIKYMGFGGRRMEFSYFKQNDQGEWEVVEPGTEGAVLKYRNDFPNYNMLGRSLELAAPTNGKNVLYVGPVNLTLDDHDEAFKYNYQVNGSPDNNDADLPTLVGGVAWNESDVSIFTKLATLMGESNANQTVGGVVMFSRKIDGENDKAGSLSIAKTIAMIDGATVNANKISVTNDSELTFANRDTSLLNTSTSYYSVVGSDEPGAYDGIRSNGVTTLNADTINVKDSSMVVESGARAIFNATTMATLDNVTVNGGAALNNAGNMTITGSTFGGNTTTGALYNVGTLSINGDTFNGNTADTRGGAIYNYVQFDSNTGYGDIPATLTINGGTFDSNIAGEQGGAIFNYGIATIDGATFVGNKTTSVNYPSMGGAIFNSGDDDYLDSLAPVMTISNTTFGDASDNTKGNTALMGGAIANESSLVDGTITLNSVNFYYNKAFNTETNASVLGGAIWNYGLITVNGDTMFKGNNATGYNVEGGAIYNAGSMTFNDTVTFDSNIATDSETSGNGAFGGAIANANGEMTFKKLATFTNNKALTLREGEEETQGGAIYNDSTMVFQEGASFNGNEATYGGAVFNEEEFVVNGNAIFSGNTAGDEGGALFNLALYGGAASVEFENVEFKGNTAATNGGAIANYGGNVDVTDATFTDNIATNGFGGAIYNVYDGDLVVEGAKFTNNSATRGGAIYTTKELSLDGAEFTGNTASLGGAIYTTADLFVEGSTFKNNTGGAIFNDGGSLRIENSTFDGNELAVSSYGEFGGSSVNGDLTVVESTFKNGVGAIEALNHDAVIIQDGTEFIGNSGAYSVVYLDGNKVVDMRDLTFRNNTMTDLSVIDALNNGDSTDERADVYIQDVTMEGNSAKSAINIISTDDSVARLYNITMDNNAGDGIILGNHVEAELANITITNNKRGDGLGRLFYNGKTANFGGTNTFTDNEAKTFVSAAGATTTFSADSTTTFDTGAITGAGTMVVEDGATLNLGTVHVEQGVFTLGGVVNGDLRNADDFLAFNVSNTFDGDGRLNLNLKGVGTYNVFEDKVFNHANVKVTSSSVFDYVWNESYDTITVSTKSANEIAAATGVKTETATTVTSLANSGNETAKQIGQMLGEALADGKTDYVEGETKKMAPEDQPVTHSVASTVQNQVLNLAANRMAGPVGRAGGDITSVGYGVWAQGLLNKTKYSGQFDGDSRGFALGFDALINKMYTIGVGYSFSNSDVNVHDGRSIDIDSNTVFLYGQYKPTKWFINATLSNTVSSYSENAVVAGVLLKTDYDVNSFGVQTMTGYDFASGITPSLGLRYLHVSTDGYDTLPGYVGDMNSNYMTAVAGAKYTIPTQKIGDVRWAPEVRAALTYDVISDKNGATVYVPGGTSYHIANDRLSRGGGELGLGVTGEWRGLEMSINYDLQLREDYTSHTGMLKLRYEF